MPGENSWNGQHSINTGDRQVRQHGMRHRFSLSLGIGALGGGAALLMAATAFAQQAPASPGARKPMASQQPAGQQMAADAGLPAGRPIPWPAPVAAMLQHPSVLRRIEAPFPDAARDAGHHGSVIVSITVAASGAVVDAAITTSSRSPLLDAAAIDAARRSTFRAGVGPQGEGIGGTKTLSYEFDDRIIDGYRCDQAVRDFDWWSRTWPETDDAMKRRLWQQFWARTMLRTKYSDRATAKSRAMFDLAWSKALAACGTAPETPLATMLTQAGIDAKLAPFTADLPGARP